MRKAPRVHLPDAGADGVSACYGVGLWLARARPSCRARCVVRDDRYLARALPAPPQGEKQPDLRQRYLRVGGRGGRLGVGQRGAALF